MNQSVAGLRLKIKSSTPRPQNNQQQRLKRCSPLSSRAPARAQSSPGPLLSPGRAHCHRTQCIWYTAKFWAQVKPLVMESETSFLDLTMTNASKSSYIQFELSPPLSEVRSPLKPYFISPFFTHDLVLAHTSWGLCTAFVHMYASFIRRQAFEKEALLSQQSSTYIAGIR